MKVIVDRLNGTLSIRLDAGEGDRKLAVGRFVIAGLDRFGVLHQLDILKPLDPELRRSILPGLARQFHVPALAHLDPGLLIRRDS
jgi:hypothetical protein